MTVRHSDKRNSAFCVISLLMVGAATVVKPPSNKIGWTAAAGVLVGRQIMQFKEFLVLTYVLAVLYDVGTAISSYNNYYGCIDFEKCIL